MKRTTRTAIIILVLLLIWGYPIYGMIIPSEVRSEKFAINDLCKLGERENIVSVEITHNSLPTFTIKNKEKIDEFSKVLLQLQFVEVSNAQLVDWHKELDYSITVKMQQMNADYDDWFVLTFPEGWLYVFGKNGGVKTPKYRVENINVLEEFVSQYALENLGLTNRKTAHILI